MISPFFLSWNMRCRGPTYIKRLVLLFYNAGFITAWINICLHTLLGSGSEWPKDKAYVACNGRFDSFLINRRIGYGWLFPFPVRGNENNSIYPLLCTWITTRDTLWMNSKKDYSLSLKMICKHKPLQIESDSQTKGGVLRTFLSYFKSDWLIGSSLIVSSL